MKNALRFLNRDQNSKIRVGFYKHYKGKMYYVHGTAKHSETLEDLVVYQAMYKSAEFGDYAQWTRPLSMFNQEIEIDDNKVWRFTALSDREVIGFEKELVAILKGL